MAVVNNEAYRAPCQAHNPGIPVYTRQELDMLKRFPHSAEVFRAAQKIKRVFPSARVADVILKLENGHDKNKEHLS